MRKLFLKTYDAYRNERWLIFEDIVDIEGEIITTN